MVGISLLVAVGTAAVWNRWPSGLRWPARGLSLVLVMAVGACLAGTAVNRAFGLYGSFGELWGSPSARFDPVGSFGVPAATTRLEILTPQWNDVGRQDAALGRGSMLRVRLGGPRSGITRIGLLYLPAAYFTDVSVRLPAVEFFHGTPGGPRNYTDQLHVADVLDREIASGRVPPLIGVFPMIDDGRAGECVNGTRGPHDETYLAVDVPADVDVGLRALPGRSFAVLGYSTGGFCAVNLGLRHPDRYVAAGSISGYFLAGTDPAVGNPYGRSVELRESNSPQWVVANRRPSAPPLYVVSSAGDPGSVAAERSFVAETRRRDPRLVLGAALVPDGGHTFASWEAALAPTLDWVARYLPRDLAPPIVLPRLP